MYNHLDNRREISANYKHALYNILFVEILLPNVYWKYIASPDKIDPLCSQILMPFHSGWWSSFKLNVFCFFPLHIRTGKVQ